MFCPNCGKDNAVDLRYCASCGTNLVMVSLALTGREDDFFAKVDTGIDQLVARYSERVFKDTSKVANERRVARSWELLGKAVVTSMVDMLLFVLMWILLPFRFLFLVISTPFRLLAERESAERSGMTAAYLPESGLWLDGPAPSVTENTTRHLKAVPVPKTGDLN